MQNPLSKNRQVVLGREVVCLGQCRGLRALVLVEKVVALILTVKEVELNLELTREPEIRIRGRMIPKGSYGLEYRLMPVVGVGQKDAPVVQDELVRVIDPMSLECSRSQIPDQRIEEKAFTI